MNKANKEKRKKRVVVEGVLIVVVRRRPAPYANNSNQLYKSRESDRKAAEAEPINWKLRGQFNLIILAINCNGLHLDSH